MRPLQLDNRIIVVTGGGGVIGSRFVKGIVENGGMAIVADCNVEAAQKAADEANKAFPGKAAAVRLDITDKSSISALISDLIACHGRIDAVVNNAYPRNANYGRKLEDVEYADFCENVDTHLGGYFLVAQQFCAAFRELGGGDVVNISSVYGVIAPRFHVYAGTPMTMPVEYAAIKSAIIHLTRYFAQYFKQDGIRVNCLSPGGVLDDQPADFLAAYKHHCAGKGMLAADDLLGTLLFLLSDESKYMTGQNLVVDDGFTL